jgi:hypothetical protein
MSGAVDDPDNLNDAADFSVENEISANDRMTQFLSRVRARRPRLGGFPLVSTGAVDRIEQLIRCV